jgi:protein TonB
MPEFPGGAGAMYSYLGGKIKYPSISADNGSQGKAYVNFTVEPDGSLSNVIVVKSSADKFCQKEAIRVVKGMPKWKPGKQRGKKVRVSFTIPIKFKLQP